MNLPNRDAQLINEFLGKSFYTRIKKDADVIQEEEKGNESGIVQISSVSYWAAQKGKEQQFPTLLPKVLALVLS